MELALLVCNNWRAMDDGELGPHEHVMRIYCCACRQDVDARLTSGAEIYPHRHDLAELPFWRCDDCGNHVGCHHQTRNRTQPLGVIATTEIKLARRHIHAILDPIWRSGKMKRASLYKKISDELGWQYHTGNIRTIEEARKVYVIVRRYSQRR